MLMGKEMEKFQWTRLCLATLVGISGAASAVDDASIEKDADGDTILVTAKQQTLQALGVSVINAEAIKERPPARDISELIRTMPGVNLTGNSTSGQRGNNRQIDIRGMGPENTLILVDGLPVSSRNSVRLGWRGERDTRGDTGWVPPEMIERIEVIRGPAAARYGNGAAGGVVNIITKRQMETLHGTLNGYMNFPQHKEEGATKRTDFSLAGPLTDNFSFRLFGGYSKTQADGKYLNQGHESERTGSYSDTIPAGREGDIDKDINAMLHWDVMDGQSLEFETGYSRQGNLYAGDTQNTNTSKLVKDMYGKETNRMYRQTYALTHRGLWDNGVSAINYVQYERTRNSRMNEGLAGGTEGIFDSSNRGFSTTQLDSLLLHSDVSIPFNLGVSQTATVGVEWNEQKMKDPSSFTQTTAGGSVPGIADANRSPYTSAQITSLFAEDNIELTDSTMLTPGLRFDYHSIVGNNWSPSLNLSQELGDYFTMKMGIARAYKAPSLYQTNPNYLLYSRGQGCYASAGACYLQGNDDLKAENSINKEIGIEFHNGDYLAGVTYFRNDYRNKIEAGYSPIGKSSTGAADIYRWENVPKAVVEGLEGSLNIPVSQTVTWNNNMTYMFKSENKKTGDYLSIIPEYTLNSSLRWQAREDWSMETTMTWYGRQKPKKYNYKGEKVTGSENNEVSPYAVFGLSSTYTVNKNLSLTGGIENIFDKRQFRAGNAQTTGNAVTNSYMYGAGAQTYNEPGRTFYVSVNTSF